MTLTAITKDLQAFCPSFDIDQGGDRDNVLNAVRLTQRSQELYCPHCYQKTGELSPVRLRATWEKRVHFAHLFDGSAVHECKDTYGETDKHYWAKLAIADRLMGQANIEEFTVDKRFVFIPSLEVKRKPDILITYTVGGIDAHEVQISPITVEEIAERTRDLRISGVSRVVWYFYGKNYSPDVRNWCADNNVQFFKLWFHGGDENFYSPRWAEGTKFDGRSPKPKKQSFDGCKEKPKQPRIDHSNFDLTKTYKWTGQINSDKAKKFAAQLRQAKLTVLFHDGAVANCRSDIEIDGTNYVNWIWLKDLEPCQ